MIGRLGAENKKEGKRSRQHTKGKTIHIRKRREATNIKKDMAKSKKQKGGSGSGSTATAAGKSGGPKGCRKKSKQQTATTSAKKRVSSTAVAASFSGGKDNGPRAKKQKDLNSGNGGGAGETERERAQRMEAEARQLEERARLLRSGQGGGVSGDNIDENTGLQVHVDSENEREGSDSGGTAAAVAEEVGLSSEADTHERSIEGTGGVEGASVNGGGNVDMEEGKEKKWN